jgi:hypothetical protein
VRCGTQTVGLVAHDGALHPGSELNHLALRLTSGDYNQTVAVLRGAGLEVTSRGDDRTIYFNDPDGHGLQLLTPAEY